MRRIVGSQQVHGLLRPTASDTLHHSEGVGHREAEESIRDWARHGVDVMGQLVRHADMLQADLARFLHDMEASTGFHCEHCEAAPGFQRQATPLGSNSFPGFRPSRRLVYGEIADGAALFGSERNRPRSSSRDGSPLKAQGEDSMEAGFVAETLPFKWPASLPRRKGLEPSINRSTTRMAPTQSQRSTSHELSKRAGRTARSSKVGQVFGCLQSLLSQANHPDSVLNACRKACVTLLLLYDALLIPYMLGFDIDFTGWMANQLFATASFWTIDMFLGFLQGYEEDGQMLVDLKLTAKRYVSSMFLLDLYVVALDWVTAILVSTATKVRSDRIIRILRLMRLAGLLRLRKISTMVVHHIFSADVEASSSLVILVSSILGFIVFFNHFQACLWAYVGEHGPTDTGAHWVDMDVLVGNDMVPYKDLNDVFQYTSIFHWHMAQLTVGNQGIHAANTIELAINIIGLLVALMMACTVVSALSATLVNYQMSVRSRTQQLRTLQQYLCENNVNHRTLSVAVKQARERARKSSKLTEKDVPALNLLSTTLQSALRYEISLPFLRSMPLLYLWTSLEPTSAQQLCKDCTTFDILLPHEVLFDAGEEAIAMHYLNSGRAEYVQHPRTSAVHAERTVEVGDKKIWMCEATLCSRWIHVGTFQALAPCEVFKVFSHRWSRALPSHHPFRDVACGFAVVYFKQLVTAKPPHAAWPDDLQVPYTRFSELVASMEPHVQEIIGLDALNEAQSRNTLPEKKAAMLKKQVRDGKSVLFLDENGQIKRVTSGVSLQIFGINGKSLVQIGKIKNDGEVAPSCIFPGHISKKNESPTESAMRLLESKLGPMADQVELGTPSQEIETRMSPEYGISTEYMQIKFVGEMTPCFSVPAKYIFGDPGVTVKASFMHRHEAMIAEAVPQAYVFPGETQGTSYCFAWLSPDELADCKQRVSHVTWWLEELRAENALHSKEQTEIEVSGEHPQVMRQLPLDHHEIML